MENTVLECTSLPFYVTYCLGSYEGVGAHNSIARNRLIIDWESIQHGDRSGVGLLGAENSLIQFNFYFEHD